MRTLPLTCSKSREIYSGLRNKAFGSNTNETLVVITQRVNGRHQPRCRKRYVTPDFQKHVVPLLGKLGCSSAKCHGSFQGQGGFRLSFSVLISNGSYCLAGKGFLGKTKSGEPEVSSQELDAAQGNQIRKT